MIVKIENPKETIRHFYSGIYHREKSDSPEQSRSSLIRRASMAFSGLREGDLVLDIGSGPQIIERQYIAAYGIPAWKAVTVDLATIKSRRLLGKKCSLGHIQADGTDLPFPDRLFSGAVSNMALDFMGPEALAELNRVLKNGSPVIVNFHHRSLIPSNVDDLVKDRRVKEKNQVVFSFWKYLKDNEILFKSKGDIVEVLSKKGFSIHRCEEQSTVCDKWWEVDMVRR